MFLKIPTKTNLASTKKCLKKLKTKKKLKKKVNHKELKIRKWNLNIKNKLYKN
jgi:phosphotransferase system IIB component